MTGQTTFTQSLIPRFETLSINDGLPHSSVYSILQDKKGFMWFGTPDGLCRYDGSELISYKYKAEFPADEVNNFARGKIQEDKNGNIWYCNETGIYKWDITVEKIIRVLSFSKKGYKNSQFSLIKLDVQGNIWMLNLVFGIVAYNIDQKKLSIFPLPVPMSGVSLLYTFAAIDNEENIWLAINRGNDPVIKFNTKNFLFSEEFVNDPPHAVFFDNQKKVLAYDDRLVFQYYNKQVPAIIRKKINGRDINYFSFDGLMDSHHRIWMTARGSGLFYYDEDKGIFHRYHHDNSIIKSLPFDLTTCLYIDRSDNLWIGIDGGGVARLDLKQPKFNIFPLSEGEYPVLQDYFTKCFYEDDKKRIWFGSHNNGFSIYAPATEQLINYRNRPDDENSLPGNVVASIYKARNGNMWIGTNAGLSIFDETNSVFKSIPIHNLPVLYPKVNLFVYKFLELKNGDFVAATYLGLVKVIAGKKGYEGYFFPENYSWAATATDVVEMDDGSLFVTMPGFGLFKIRNTLSGFDTVKRYLHSIDLRSIRKDEINKNSVWIGSGKGLIHFNTISGQFKIYDENDGLANSYVYGSLEDEKHNLWISTNGGLSYLDRITGRIDNYTYQDGLQSNEFNTQAFYKSRTNTFYFGGIKGFNWFQSKKFTDNNLKPQVAITRLEIDNVLFAKDSALLIRSYIELPYYRNDLNFNFAALDYTRPDANRIQYRLEGWDTKWVTTYARSARYSNLPPGEYTMVTRASNADGLWSNDEQLKIIIQKPFWKETVFYVVLFLLIIFVIVFAVNVFIRQRVKQKLRHLEKQAAINIERTRISKDMHDEIGNGLTQIALLSELIQLQQPGADIKRDITGISTSARKMVQSMSEIVWALNPQNDTLDNLLAYIRERSHQYFEGMKVEFMIDFPEVLPQIILTNDQRRNLFLVTKEALANALKHAGGSYVHLTLIITKEKYCFTVKDDGIGMPANKIKVGSNGLKNMEKRMEDIGGNIIWIREQQGTTVEYCLPV